VPGFDLTYRPPKSVSLLWALGDRPTADEVVAAHDAAVAAAVGYLEREAGYSRRGAGGAETVKVDRFVAAAFRHRTSRANDPLLHTHVLVANLARTTDDGVWRTLDSRRLFAHAKTAGVLYQAQLRFELTRRLGGAWQPVVNGHADLQGIGVKVIEQFSQRRAAIVEHMTARGETSAAAAQVATLETRQAKGERLSEAELRARWQQRGRGLGFRDGWHEKLTGRTTPQPADVAVLAGELVDREALTEQSSSFTRRDLLQAIADRLPTGATVDNIEQLADRVLAHDPARLVELGTTRGELTSTDVIRLADGRVVPSGPGERRYTTRGLLLTESHAINTAQARARDGVAVVDDTTIEEAVRGRTLSDEQAAMVRRLTSSGAGVDVVVGKAGTGKTYALDAARHAWQQAGIPVQGVALAARAALELQQSAGIESTTIAALERRLTNSKDDVLPAGSVLIVDEAGMVGTRQLARLLHHAERRQVKVVLVGDPRQLPEIDAGGLYRALTNRLPAVELTDNRRQHHQWEQAALDELRHGNPTAALDTYRAHGRIVTADTPDDLREQLVEDWWDTARDGMAGSIMIGLRRADVDDLNHRARARMLQDGRLTGPVIQAAGVELQVGDRIVGLRNSRRHGIVNGTRATITRIDRARHELDATTDDGRTVVLTRDYLDAGHVTHGYAITGHKAQGLTVDNTYVLGSEALYREWGYVALSRGRQTNRLYQTVLDQHLDEIHYHVHQTDDPNTALGARMARSRAQESVTPELKELAVQWRALHRRLTDDDIARSRTLGARRSELVAARQHTAARFERLQRRLDDSGRGLGRVRNRAQAADLRQATAQLAEQLGAIDRQIERIDTELAELPTPMHVRQLTAKHAALTRQLRQAAEARLARHDQDPPAYLSAALGPRPDERASAWDRATVALEDYRLRWSITDPDRTFPTPPTDELQRDDFRHALQTAKDARIELLTERHQRQRPALRQRGLAR
jgi:Ti-type conjugative transfer relaxase TraA